MNKARSIRLLSYNIQVGIHTKQLSDYVTASWQHLLPNQKRLENLNQISQMVRGYDFVALQEVDAGSIRSNFINQVEYLATQAAYPYWYHQCNRNFGKFAKHSNGLLSKLPVNQIINHKLPGLIPGRGAIEARLGNEHQPLTLVIAHLSLSKRARSMQLHYLAEQLTHAKHLIIMGDLNCSATELLDCFASYGLTMQATNSDTLATFPSWQPVNHFDHILVSDSLNILTQKVLPIKISDHLPIELELELPESILNHEQDEHTSKRYHPVRISNEQHSSARKLH